MEVGRKRIASAMVGAGVWACVLAAAAPAAEDGGKLVACKEPGWPQWRGPRRDAVSDETGLLASWPEGGPKRLWTAEDLGKGYSSPVFGGGAAFITGDVREQLRIFALSPDGKAKWTAVNGAGWKKSFPGGRGSCCYDEGRVYHMNAHGRVVCLDAADGKELWAVEVFKRFNAQTPPFGSPECLLVDGERLIVSPGGKGGLLAALSKKTGDTVWACDLAAEGDETAGYSSPILIERNGRRQVIATSSARTFAADAETGKVLWSFPLDWNKQATSTIPLFCGGSVFVTNTIRTDCTFYRLRPDDANRRAERAWAIKLANGHGSLLCAGGRIYGADQGKLKGWVCVEPETGKVLYVKKDLAAGSAAFADGRLYCLTETGEAALLKPGADGFEAAGRFELVKGKKDVWAHPVVLDGRLYLRYHEKLYCYDVRGR